ncbi:class I SAM-dependent methyltransferase [Aeromicrobium sp.]|uniref:class I SAM-dependent methyltransferase n=1 Tax=Aeromicrobium sp. TaxID=1871063 RepID=UPI003D6BCAB7
MTESDEDREKQNEHRRRAWNKSAYRYDQQIGWWERRVLGEDNREWACSRASGDVLEVAVGTGLNIPLYDPGTAVVGIDLSPAMLEIGRRRAQAAGRDVDLREGDAQDLPFDDGSFDSVVCTFSLCNIPDPDVALAEMHRVLRDRGRLILVDHIRSSVRPVRWFQRAIEVVSMRMNGDHMTRRPSESVERHGFRITERERFNRGVVERLVAVKAS